MKLLLDYLSGAFFLNKTATTEIYYLSLHYALPKAPANVVESEKKKLADTETKLAALRNRL